MKKKKIEREKEKKLDICIVTMQTAETQHKE